MMLVKTTKPIIRDGYVAESRTTWMLFGIPVLVKRVLHPKPSDVKSVTDHYGSFEWNPNP